MDITKVTIAFITGLFGLLSGIITTYIKQKNTSKREDEQREAEKNLLINHYIFNKLTKLKNQVLQTFTLKNKGKELIFKDILSNQIMIYIKELTELAKNIDNGHIKTSDHLLNSVLKSNNNINDNLHNYYKNNSMYTEEEKKALDIVMSKYDNWEISYTENLLENIGTCCNSQFYNSIDIKASVIFDIYLTCAVELINSAQKTLNCLNGDLRGLVFKGVRL